jgi:hypothetical protein
VDDQQQGQSALPSPPSPSPGPAAAARLALTGGNADALLVRLVSSLRSGLPGPRLRDVGLTLQLAATEDSFALFARRKVDDSAVQPSGQLAIEAARTGLADMGAPDGADRTVALMVQDMAAFGGTGLDAVRLARSSEDHRFDYFA